jgi:hypothetical protein
MVRGFDFAQPDNSKKCHVSPVLCAFLVFFVANKKHKKARKNLGLLTHLSFSCLFHLGSEQLAHNPHY